MRLDDIADLGDVDFLKLDVQGSELDVLHGASRVLSEAVFVMSEVEFVEMYEGQPLFADIDAEMRKNGFMFHGFSGFASRAFAPMIVRNNPNDGLNQPVWGDARYVRDPKFYSDLSTTKLLKLALIMHDLVGSYDLKLVILNLLDKRCDTKPGVEYLSRFS